MSRSGSGSLRTTSGSYRRGPGPTIRRAHLKGQRPHGHALQHGPARDHRPACTGYRLRGRWCRPGSTSARVVYCAGSTLAASCPPTRRRAPQPAAHQHGGERHRGEEGGEQQPVGQEAPALQQVPRPQPAVAVVAPAAARPEGGGRDQRRGRQRAPAPAGGGREGGEQPGQWRRGGGTAHRWRGAEGRDDAARHRIPPAGPSGPAGGSAGSWSRPPAAPRARRRRGVLAPRRRF